MEIPKFTRIKWMVYELDRPLRGFETREQAMEFASIDPDLEIREIPPSFVKFDDGPF